MKIQQTPSGIEYKIVTKEDSKFMKFLNFFIKIFNKSFMTHYITTIGKTIYTPGGTISDITLKHEEKHIEDSVKYPIIYELSYLFPPSILTFRHIWEKRGYEITIRETYKQSPILAKSFSFKGNVINQFTSSAYLWMWPFRKNLEKWYDSIIADCEAKNAHHMAN